jgi:lipoyl(octanoyl) transferase
LAGTRREALLLNLGSVEYGRALELQHGLVALRQANEISDTLVLLEHPPVITIGKSGQATNLRVPEPELARRGIAVRRIERGGDVTYHGPGQLVGYPVFSLRQGIAGVRAFVEGVEQALVAALGRLGVSARLRPGLVGVWVAERKIASLGVAVRRAVTFHGFALNVTTDLDAFRLINPCGMPDVTMTSVEREGGNAAGTRSAVVSGFEREFGIDLQPAAGQSHLPRSFTSLTNGLSAAAIDSASARG